MRAAVEVQLDPALTRNQRRKRLGPVAQKIAYWQSRWAEATRAHRKLRIRSLRSRGFFLSAMPKCFLPHVAL